MVITFRAWQHGFMETKRKLCSLRPDGGKLAAREALKQVWSLQHRTIFDWEDEIRQATNRARAIARRAHRTEANLRFGTPETLENRHFWPPFCWQNWIFIRPNAVERMVH